MMKLLALLAVLVYATDAAFFSPLGMKLKDIVPRQQKRQSYNSCESFLQECAAPLAQYEQYMSGYESGTELLQSGIMDQLCSDLADFTSCSHSAGQACGSQELTDAMEAASAFVSYMCSAEGRATLLEMSTSECATNPAMASLVTEVFQTCYNDFEMEVNMFVLRAMNDDSIEDPMAHLCPLLEEFQVCSVEGVGYMCGDAYGRFISAMWNVMGETVFGDMNCDSQVNLARRMVTKAIDFVRRRR